MSIIKKIFSPKVDMSKFDPNEMETSPEAHKAITSQLRRDYIYYATRLKLNSGDKHLIESWNNAADELAKKPLSEEAKQLVELAITDDKMQAYKKGLTLDQHLSIS